ncbi:superoxide dismutase family protein [Ruminococcus gauvreauii]|uniref:Superoxide dismutase family protein n=1 Tax=Ruminococcus gauvreauii TaxID=438033 RepID=A0ABY5VHN8_9FIRM|nr:superoxide dismutase family protein [Ruminococcus gauvreauii]UWP59912.1 superoxide dismutase family protein [Ruminococcus gauvreauii]
MEIPIKEIFSTLMDIPLEAYAPITGSEAYAGIQGTVYFYPLWDGTFVIADVAGLPFEEGTCTEKIFGFHIHTGETCTGNEEDPFADTGLHYNPDSCPHPEHAGDLPPLFGNNGYALTMFYTNRFVPEEVIGHTVVIHDMPDDFHTQPAGDSGSKIACAEIKGTDGK